MRKIISIVLGLMIGLCGCSSSVNSNSPDAANQSNQSNQTSQLEKANESEATSMVIIEKGDKLYNLVSGLLSDVASVKSIKKILGEKSGTSLFVELKVSKNQYEKYFSKCQTMLLTLNFPEEWDDCNSVWMKSKEGTLILGNYARAGAKSAFMPEETAQKDTVLKLYNSVFEKYDIVGSIH